MNDQVSFWNGNAGDRWVSEQATLDAMTRPFGAAALDAARVALGEAVLDVGCGCGDTSLTLADRVGPTGRVAGVDLSHPMLSRARERGAGRSNVTFLEGDAASAPLDRGAFDLLYSRFGVMFFPDPVGAFTRLRRALRPTGRVAFVCWRPFAENPWARVPFEAAANAVGKPEPTPPEDAPGPFAFGDATRVRGILESSGFHGVTVRPFDAANSFGGSGSIADAAQAIARLGPVARLLVDRDESDVRRALSAIEAVLPPYAGAHGGVTLPAAAWVVTAANTGA